MARRLPPWAKWAAAYAATLGVSAGLGALARIGPGNGVFVAGAVCIFASIAFIRLGGDKAVVGRSMQGAPKWGVDPERRREEIRRGWSLFLLGLALWGALVAVWLATGG